MTKPVQNTYYQAPRVTNQHLENEPSNGPTLSSHEATWGVRDTLVQSRSVVGRRIAQAGLFLMAAGANMGSASAAFAKNSVFSSSTGATGSTAATASNMSTGVGSTGTTNQSSSTGASVSDAGTVFAVGVPLLLLTVSLLGFGACAVACFRAERDHRRDGYEPL